MPSVITVVSETIQEFEGKRYYRCGAYFQRDGRRLHRVVWESTHGRSIPDGYHVHHCDEDKSNNDPSNLALVEGGEHVSMHQSGHGRRISAAALDAAADWHRSGDGREWHRQHYKRTKDALHRDAEFICEHCGVRFIAKDRGTNRFCSNACKTKARFASGVDDEERTCVICKAEFRVNRYRKTQTCSRSCHGTLSSRARVGESRGRVLSRGS